VHALIHNVITDLQCVELRMLIFFSSATPYPYPYSGLLMGVEESVRSPKLNLGIYTYIYTHIRNIWVAYVSLVGSVEMNVP